jgi:deoxyribose-phosphate aldolase
MNTYQEKLSINRMIDHTLLKADATIDQIQLLCDEAKSHHFFSVCINPYYVQNASSLLKGSDVLVCTVIGFPLGANSTETKIFETKKAIADGAQEIDMVINLGAVKNKEWDKVQKDIQEVVRAAHPKKVKVILETCLLDENEKIKSCELASLAGAHFVKTSTGFSISGATIEDVKLMKKSILQGMEVKASGGVRDLKTAQAMIAAGATRLGTSSGVAILKGITSGSTNEVENY